ncbi:hypothetical protein CC2G_004024 [Coprinopsis cinerea AmutBmut pab1-1]|nr:hypothetical protein CC2G_004024 [Coprinopsis cinerea AmutBmut pab1-1]
MPPARSLSHPNPAASDPLLIPPRHSSQTVTVAHVADHSTSLPDEAHTINPSPAVNRLQPSPRYKSKQSNGDQAITGGSSPSPHLRQVTAHLDVAQAQPDRPTVITENPARASIPFQYPDDRRSPSFHSSLPYTSIFHRFSTTPGISPQAPSVSTSRPSQITRSDPINPPHCSDTHVCNYINSCAPPALEASVKTDYQSSRSTQGQSSNSPHPRSRPSPTLQSANPRARTLKSVPANLQGYSDDRLNPPPSDVYGPAGTTYYETPSGGTNITKSHGLQAFRIDLPPDLLRPHLFSIHSDFLLRFQAFRAQEMYNSVYFVVHSPYAICIKSQCVWSWRAADNTEINQTHPICQHDYLYTTGTHVYRFNPVVLSLSGEERQAPVTLSFYYYRTHSERYRAIIQFQLQ